MSQYRNNPRNARRVNDRDAKIVSDKLNSAGFSVSQGEPWMSDGTVFVTCDRGVVTILVQSDDPASNLNVGSLIESEVRSWPYVRGVSSRQAPDGGMFVWLASVIS